MLRTITLVLLLAGPALADEPAQTDSPATTTRPAVEATPATGVDRIRQEAAALKPLFKSPLAQRFLAATARLPHIDPRTIYGNAERKYLSKAAWEKLPKEEQANYREITIDENRYYVTLYGTPLFYGRLVDLLGEHGVTTFEGKKVLDFGYGTVGHLRLMADCGADVVGVDVDSLHPAIYADPSDVGSVKNPDGKDGRIRMVLGRFPTDDDVRAQIGNGYDIFTSKNTLKNGYIHPAEKVDPRMTIDLGVTDEQYVQAVRDILKPGGLALIYNLCPAPAAKGEPYIPWADGRCPFPRAMWEANGFEVIAFDQDDSVTARKMGKALGWDQPPQASDLENDMFAHWTLVRKKR